MLGECIESTWWPIPGPALMRHVTRFLSVPLERACIMSHVVSHVARIKESCHMDKFVMSRTERRCDTRRELSVQVRQ